MGLMKRLEHAVGNEYLISSQDLLVKTSQNKKRQANSNKVVVIGYPTQPHSNKIVRLK